MEQPSETILLCTSSTPCAVALRKGILRRRRPSVDIRPPSSALSEAHKCVAFAEEIEEHQADDWDRSCCAVARPTFRDILELKQIQRELLPDGRGVVKDKYGDDDDFTFSMDDGDDVDSSQRCRRPPPPPCASSLNRSTIRPGSKLLNRVPVALCPILPDTSSTSSSTSSITSPVQSPPSSPALGPKRSHPKPMKFCPLLPVCAPLECATPPPSVAQSRVPSPTLVNTGASSEKVDGSKPSSTVETPNRKTSTPATASTASTAPAPLVESVRNPEPPSSNVTSSLLSSSPRSAPSSPILIAAPAKRDIPALSRSPPRRAFDFIPLVPSTSPVHSPPSRRNSGSFCSSSPNAGMMGSPIIMFNSPVQT